MAVVSKLALALTASSVVAALPWDQLSQSSTHRTHITARGEKFTGYHPETAYEVFETGIEHPLSKRADISSEEAAVSYLESKGFSKDNISARTSLDAETAAHVYLNQKLNGINVANAVANVALKDGKVVAYGTNFVIKPSNIAPATPTLTEADAIKAAESSLSGTYNSWPTKIEYVLTDRDHAALTYVIQVQNDEHWYEAFVDAHTGKVVNIVDFVAQAAYRAIPIQNQDPTVGGFSLITDPQDLSASPNGWHKVGSTTYTTTRGNNVVSYKSSTSSTSAQTSANQVFDYTWNSAVSPTTSPNIDVARVNAFYVVNKIHDIMYKYGFTEAAYNFQAENYGKGGSGNDAVEMYVQAPGTNNANFATPADGQPGHANMYLWTFNTPNRDGDLSNDVITHELTHGTSNRMTGGGTGRCLSTTEAGGMGEGWSDAFAFAFEQKSATIGDFTLGAWVYNNPKGIRSYPYSTSKTTNPLTYGSLRTLTEVHDIGEVWALTLYEVFASLIQTYGFSASIENPDQTAGNIVWLHLITDAFSLQPCNPTFISARNAIIQADTNRYAGANKCLLWKAFAKRGLGYGATTTKTDSTTLPTGC